jgi:putative acetyltransferase
MQVTIRSEQVSDYHAIAEVNALAFAPLVGEPDRGAFVSEFAVVDAQRHGASYDPDLSLVAELDGRVVGHALFYPCRTLVGGVELHAVYLAPLAVHPDHQRQGIGGALLKEGHRRARERGASYAFLLGHASYYPRYGYQTGMFGRCRLLVRAADVSAPIDGIAMRLVEPKDLAWLCALWRQWFEDVDLAIVPEASLFDWIPHSREVMAGVIEQRGEPIGYVRHARSDPTDIKLIVARDAEALRGTLGHLAGKLSDADASFRLPLHPDAAGVQRGLRLAHAAEVQAWDAGMIKVLDSRVRPIVDYVCTVKAGQRSPGLIIWPPYIELA